MRRPAEILLDDAAQIDALRRRKAERRVDGRREGHVVPLQQFFQQALRRVEHLPAPAEHPDGQAHGLLFDDEELERTKRGMSFKEPKSVKSRRLIALPQLAVRGLKQHRAHEAATKLQLGPAYQDNDLVCPREDGRPWDPEGVSDSFRWRVRRSENRRIRFHDLRHTHASQLLKQGVHPKVVSERLGHATIGITLDTCSHLLPGLQEEAATKVDLALRTAISRSHE
jgi:Phage integrase family